MATHFAMLFRHFIIAQELEGFHQTSPFHFTRRMDSVYLAFELNFRVMKRQFQIFQDERTMFIKKSLSNTFLNPSFNWISYFHPFRKSLETSINFRGVPSGLDGLNTISPPNPTISLIR